MKMPDKQPAKIQGLGDITIEELSLELQEGARFVVYQYCVSILVLSFRRGSAIHFVRSSEKAWKRGLPYSGLSFLLGWWGVPWGIFWTIGAIIYNFRGGGDVTAEIVNAFRENLEAQKQANTVQALLSSFEDSTALG